MQLGAPRVQVELPDDLHDQLKSARPYPGPGGTVLTGDRADLEALAAHADTVHVELV